MLFSCLSKLSTIASPEQISLLDSYFSTLKSYSKTNITASKVAVALHTTPEGVRIILSECVAQRILAVSYAVRCPSCSTFLKRYDDISKIPDSTFDCYACDDSFVVSADEIVVMYRLIPTPDFLEGQQNTTIEMYDACDSVAQGDTLHALLLSDTCYPVLYNPSDDEYAQLFQIAKAVRKRGKTSKLVGDTLETLAQYLFGLCKGFIAAPLRTQTNQIDCCVRNCVRQYGIFARICASIIIECKNEEATPSGSYLRKLSSIISDFNAHAKVVGLGVIISKRPGPRTFRAVATKEYLKTGTIYININLTEIEDQLLEKRINLLTFLEHKMFETVFDATIDLQSSELYKA